MSLNFEANVTGIDKSVRDAVNRINSKGGLNLKINDKSFTQPLGRITQQANEFTKSLEASNARVIAFGASVGVLNLIKNSFESLVVSVVKVEKALADVNVILNVSSDRLNELQKGLFSVAKNTAQSFEVVTDAAVEFARQGLSVEETLKRTNDALILTRLTGMKSAESVRSLTAAMNTFTEAGLTSTQVLNKMAAVDVRFAVSSSDLAAAISRTGQAAISAGVNIDELMGIVTAAQQKTARGGAVIGNAFKTIFTRIQQPETLDQLEKLGIAVRDVEYNTLPAIQILKNLSDTYNQLSDAQKSNITRTVAGVYQINILKAALADASSQNSILARATEVSANATDEAIRKNKQLNDTLASMSARASIGLQELSKNIGDITLAPGMKSVLEFVNSMVEGLNNLTTGESAGSKFFQGFLSGVGKIATGPGLVLFAAVVGKLFKNAFRFATQSVRDLMGVQTQAQKLRAIEESIVGVLQRNSVINKELLSLEGNRAAQEALVLNLIQQQTASLNAQRSIARSITPGLARAGVNQNLTVNTGTRKFSKGGIVPNFAPRTLNKSQAQSMDTGYILNAKLPGKKAFGQARGIGSKEKPYNTTGSGIYMLTPEVGLPPTAMTAKGKSTKDPYFTFLVTGLNDAALEGKKPLKKNPKTQLFDRISGSIFKNTANYINAIQPKGITKKVSSQEIRSGFDNTLGAKGALTGVIGSSFEVGLNKAIGYIPSIRGEGGDFDVRGGIGVDTLSQLFNLQGGIPIRMGDFKATKSKNALWSFAGKLAKELNAGFVTEAPRLNASGRQSSSEIMSKNQYRYQLERRYGQTSPRVKEKLLDDKSFIKFGSGGSVPNFSPLGDAIGREMAAGVPAGAIRVGQSPRLVSSANPAGIGVYNTIHEPNGIGQGINRSISEGRNPKTYGLPNFASGSPSNTINLGHISQLGLPSNHPINDKLIASNNKLAATNSQLGGNLVALTFLLPSLIEGLSNSFGNKEAGQKAASVANAGLSAGLSASFVLPTLIGGLSKLIPIVAKLNPYTAALSTAIGLASAAFSFFSQKTDESTASQQRNKQALEEHTNKIKSLQQSLGSSLGSISPTIKFKSGGHVPNFADTNNYSINLRDFDADNLNLDAPIVQIDSNGQINVTTSNIEAQLREKRIQGLMHANRPRNTFEEKDTYDPNNISNVFDAMSIYKPNNSPIIRPPAIPLSPLLMERADLTRDYVDTVRQNRIDESLSAINKEGNINEVLTAIRDATSAAKFFGRAGQKSIADASIERLMTAYGKLDNPEEALKMRGQLTELMSSAKTPDKQLENLNLLAKSGLSTKTFENTPGFRLNFELQSKAAQNKINQLKFDRELKISKRSQMEKIYLDQELGIASRGASQASISRLQRERNILDAKAQGRESIQKARASGFQNLQQFMGEGTFGENLGKTTQLKILKQISEGQIKNTQQLNDALEGEINKMNTSDAIRSDMLLSLQIESGLQNQKVEEAKKSSQLNRKIISTQNSIAQAQEEYERSIRGGIDSVLKTVRTDLENAGAGFGESMASTFRQGFQDGLNNMVSGSNFKSVFLDFSRSIFGGIQNQLSQRLSNQLTNYLFSSGGYGSSITSGLGKLLGFASGGQVPAMVMGGEYLINKHAASKIGLGNLNAINRGSMPKNFAEGGRVSSRLLAEPDPEMSAIFSLRSQKASQDAAYKRQLTEWRKARRRAAIGTFLNTFLSLGMNRMMSPGAYGAGTFQGGDVLPATGGAFGGGLSGSGIYPGQIPAARGGMIRGGSGVKDDIPTVLQGGEFVMRKSAVQKYGKGFMDRLNSGMNEGGVVGNMELNKNSTSSSPNSTNVTININMSGGEGGSPDISSNSTNNSDDAKNNREFSQKIKSVVMQVIREEQRVGGTLNKRNPGT